MADGSPPLVGQVTTMEINFGDGPSPPLSDAASARVLRKLSDLSRASFAGSSCSPSEFILPDVDISRNHGHGVVPVPGRESHTADLKEFDRYIKIMEKADRLEQDQNWGLGDGGDGSSDDGEGDDESIDIAASAASSLNYRPIGMKIDMNKMDLKNGEGSKVEDEPMSNGTNLGLEESCTPTHPHDCRQAHGDDTLLRRTQYPFNHRFWAYVRSILSNAKPVGFDELPNPEDAALKTPEDASNFLGKVIAIGLLNPIQPAVIAKEGGFNEDEVLAELLYGTLVGLVAMRFAPECIQCGSAVMDTDMLGRVPSKALCGGCNKPNVIESMDKIKVMFLLNSDVLYILAENYACQPSKESMSVTSVFAAVPANSTGSGYSYCVGTGEETEIAPALEPGRYRMHCPVAKTDNYLVVQRKATENDEKVKLNMKVSDLVYSHKKGKKKLVLTAPHGRIQFDIFPDTRSFFVLWVQKDADDKTLMHLPEDERPQYTSAAKVMHHPIFNALFQDNQVVSVQKNAFLSISNVILVFTDIVDSTKLYASLGDGQAFTLVRKHFQVLFGAFTRNGGRVVKTIGDAVMGSFTTGRAALTAISEAMEMLPMIGRRPDNNNYVEIRVGIHSGPCTVVPLNGINDFFGQTANIAARVQSAAKASECFVTETVLDGSEDSRDAYNEITKRGSPFKATPITELRLKGVDGKVHARGFRWEKRSRRESELSSSNTSIGYTDRKRVNRTYSCRSSIQSIDSVGEEELGYNGLGSSKHFERPGALGRRKSNLDVYDED